MTDDHYAPPKANVIDTPQRAEGAPALWNPDAAASWSLLLTTIFGTWLHWKNEQAIGEPRRIASARNWFALACVVVGISVGLAIVAPRIGDGSLRLVNIVFLLVWYFSAAKPQAKYVKENFGTGYPRRGWLKPIGVGLGIFVAFCFGVGFLFAIVEAIH